MIRQPVVAGQFYPDDARVLRCNIDVYTNPGTPDALRAILRAHARHGTTGLLLTTITQSREKIGTAQFGVEVPATGGLDHFRRNIQAHQAAAKPGLAFATATKNCHSLRLVIERSVPSSPSAASARLLALGRHDGVSSAGERASRDYP